MKGPWGIRVKGGRRKGHDKLRRIRRRRREEERRMRGTGQPKIGLNMHLVSKSHRRTSQGVIFLQHSPIYLVMVFPHPPSLLTAAAGPSLIFIFFVLEKKSWPEDGSIEGFLGRIYTDGRRG